MSKLPAYLLAFLPTGFSLALTDGLPRAFRWLGASLVLVVVFRLLIWALPIFVVIPLFFFVLLPITLAAAIAHVFVSLRAAHRATELRYKRFFVFVILAVILSGTVSVVTESFFARSFVTPSGSMSPNLNPGDRFYARKFGASAPLERGMMVTIVSPLDRNIRFVKRLVAVEGDVVSVTDGVLTVNGERKTEGTSEKSDAGSYLILNGVGSARNWEGTIPAGQIFVLSDNRPDGFDSRNFGPIPREDITELPLFVWWGRPGFRLQPSAIRN